jgi:hypothetical protein
MDISQGVASTEVTVRWWDGYMEVFEVKQVRFGCDLLWLRLKNNRERCIPLRHVRWWSSIEESHQGSVVHN